MPKIHVGGLNLFYETYGEGAQTLTLIRGLGSDLLAWWAQVPEFSRHFRTIVFDNRDAGRSDKPEQAYTIRQMADDTKNLLDPLRVQRTALLGVSMGGMIAQEFALAYPAILSCVIFGCTNFGGSGTIQASQEIVAAITAGDKPGPELQAIQEKAVFCDETLNRNREVVRKYYEARSHYPISQPSLARQVAAITRFDVSARLTDLKVPALVMTGTADRLVPPQNSRLIASRIPGARLLELPGGHLFFSEYPAQFNDAVVRFVRAHP